MHTPDASAHHAVDRRRSRRRAARTLSAVLLAAALALAGCAADAGGDSDSGAGDGKAAGQRASGVHGPDGGQADESAATAGEKPGASGAKLPRRPAGAHIIRTATLTVRVKDVPKALAEVRTAAEDAGGIVGDEKTSRDGEGRDRSRVVLRVPQERYEEVLAALEGTGRLVARDAKAKDVTDQVVDVESRVRSQRAGVARVRELMDEATKLSDVVTLEGELSARQADLEALLARRASLKDRTTLATITLSLTERPARADSGNDDGPTLVDALAGGWNAFVTVLRWVGIALAGVLPFAAVAALLLLLWLRVVRPGLPRQARPAEPGSDDGGA
ncbi:DUF4349 domain-containing protein [Streptomyces sp. A1499]|uniref:DUF4349 domain-containing protein n=1 Tax=Streptomyces sp. A1499 TaxID=2563104 RepID=UPI00109E9FF5|nr:DUF4349 domain-containing protein [Streptomyces sp. A1499]THC42738.1 DUF4349 domain-containing protein [Streptomyces sp. A1499]